MIGRFYNYRYRFNINILPELSSGNGFVDTVMVIRGKENSLISIPIIIEHKQGDRAEGSIDKALEEAKNYSLGFQSAGVPFLTSSKSRIYVGINLDRNPFYGIDSLTTELLGLSFIENYFNEVPEDMESLNKMTEEIKEELKKIKNTLTCVNKKAENECSLNNKINNFFNTFYGFASLSHQYNIRMNAPELINNLFACRVSDSNCKPEDSGLFHCLSQAGIVLVEGSTEPKSMVIFNFHPYKEKRRTLPLNEIKGMMGDINKLTNILENKINVNALITDKEDSIIKTDRYSGFDDYKEKHDKLLDKCEFVEIPYPKALTDEFIEAICSLPNSLNDANHIFKEFDDFFKRIPEVFNSDYFYSGDEKKFEMILFGLLLGYKILIDKEGTIECKNKMEINDVEALTQYQMGYNDGTIDLLIKLGSNDKPMGIELKRNKGRSQESECKNSLEKYNKGNAYRELTDNRKMMLIGYILDDRNKAVKPCKANSEEGGLYENRRANINMLGNVSLDMLDHFSAPRVIHLRQRREVTADTLTSGAQRPSFYPATVIKNLFSAISPWFYSGSEMLSSWWSPSTLDTREGLYNSSSNVHTEEQTFNGSLLEVGDQWLSQGNVQGSLQLLDWLVRRYTGHKLPQPVVTYTPSWEVSSAQAGEFVDDFHKNLQRAILASGVKPATVIQQLDEVTLRNQVAQSLYAGKPLKELEKLLKKTVDRIHRTIGQRATGKQADKFIDYFNRHHQNYEVDIRQLQQQCAGLTESNRTLAAASVPCREGLSPTPWLTSQPISQLIHATKA